MALIVEDGTGLPNANSYVSVAWVTDYHLLRGNVEWQKEPSKHTAACVQATQYADIRWGRFLRGSKQFEAQAKEFPRGDGIPERLKEAIAEYALAALSGPLMPRPIVHGGRVVEMVEEWTGPMKEKKHFARGIRFAPYPMADQIMRPLVCTQQRVIRA